MGNLQQWIIVLAIVVCAFLLLIYAVLGKTRSHWLGLCALLIGLACGYSVMKSLLAGAPPSPVLAAMAALAVVGVVRQY